MRKLWLSVLSTLVASVVFVAPALPSPRSVAPVERDVGAAISMGLMPASPDGGIRGPKDDRVFGGAHGHTISGAWARPDLGQLDAFMLYLPTVVCDGGVPAVDLRRLVDLRPARGRGMNANATLSGGAISRSGRFQAEGTNVVGYATPNGDVSGAIEESISGTVRGSRITGQYSATIWLSDGEGKPFALCLVDRVHWTGRDGAGRVFVGGTWRNPAYVERSASGDQVPRLRIATSLVCEDGSIWQGYTGFTKLPVDHGHVSLASEAREPWDVGELHDITQGGATFHGNRVTGTLSDDLTTLNPAGETTAHCSQAPFTWTAYSSK